MRWEDRKKTWLPEDAPPPLEEPDPYFVRGPEELQDDTPGFSVVFLLPSGCRMPDSRRPHEVKFWLVGMARCLDPTAEYLFVHHHNNDRPEPMMLGGRLVFSEIDAAARMVSVIQDTWVPKRT